MRGRLAVSLVDGVRMRSYVVGAPDRGEPESAAEVAGWVVRWLAATDLRDVTLIGHSFGSQPAAHVAAQAPSRVRLLVLLGPTFDPAYRTLTRALWRLVIDLPRERPSLLALEGLEWLRVGLRQVRAMVRVGLRDRLEETVSHVLAPVLVIVGEHETLSTREWTRSLVAADASGGERRHVVMPGLPHSSAHADPVGFAQLVLKVSRL